MKPIERINLVCFIFTVFFAGAFMIIGMVSFASWFWSKI